MADAIGLIRLVWDAGRGLWWLVTRNRRNLSPEQVMDLRTKWKPEFERRIWERQRLGLGLDAIIRDMRRIDNYPDVEERRRISPWFRVGLMGTYHRGILAGLRWGTLTKDETTDTWRYTNYREGERGDIKIIQIGYIPYENIESVDWDGDEFYNFPHIYCHFVEKDRQPYEKIAFCEKKELNGFPFYTKVAPLEPTHRLSRKRGVRYFG
jgi:hypothetical protein